MRALVIEDVYPCLLIDVEAEVLRIIHGAGGARAACLARGGARRRLVVVRRRDTVEVEQLSRQRSKDVIAVRVVPDGF